MTINPDKSTPFPPTPTSGVQTQIGKTAPTVRKELSPFETKSWFKGSLRKMTSNIKPSLNTPEKKKTALPIPAAQSTNGEPFLIERTERNLSVMVSSSTDSIKRMMKSTKSWIIETFAEAPRKSSNNETSGDCSGPEITTSKTRISMAFTLIQTAIFWLTDGWLDHIRPAKEFIRFNIRMPDSKTWAHKVESKVDRFLSNYYLIAALFFVLAILCTSFALSTSIFIPSAICYGLYRLDKRVGGVVIRNYRIPLIYQLAFVILLAMPFSMYYGLPVAVYWAGSTTVGFVLLHSTFHPDDFCASTNSSNN